VVRDAIEHAPAERAGFIREQPFPKVLGRLLVRPECLVQIAWSFRRLAVIVGAVDPNDLRPACFDSTRSGAADFRSGVVDFRFGAADFSGAGGTSTR